MKPIRFSRILCPVTFSNNSRLTVEGAAILAAMSDGELRLFHVISTHGCDNREDADAVLASLVGLSQRLPRRTRVSTAVTYGDPALEIAQHARLMKSDLVIVGAGLKVTPAEFIKTVPAHVVAHARCPVLVMRPTLASTVADGGHGFRQVVCCVDLESHPSDCAHYALSLADNLRARLTLLTVTSEQHDSANLDGHHINDIDDRGRFVHIALTGSPGPEIVALAEQIQSDLIIIGARQNTEPIRAVGSVAAYVMAHSPCAVLIVPNSSSAIRRKPSNGQRGAMRPRSTDGLVASICK